MMKKCKLMPKFLMLLMIGIIIIGLFSISRYSYYVSLSCEKLEISKISGKIYINGNSGWIDFKNDGNCTGEGTYSEPYVIEDLVIEGAGSGSYIRIENSDVYFKIENCTISGASVSGIRLSNVTNSLLNNNTLNNNDNGITLIGSNYNTISGNIIINNDDQGIYIYGSADNDILSNNVNYNRIGIHLELSTNNNVTGNTADNNFGQDGIALWWSSDNDIVGNSANENSDFGIYIAYGNTNTVLGNTANNNLGESGISILQCSNTDLRENIANNNFIAGIALFHSDSNDISGNIANDNSIAGIALDHSDNNDISGNTANNNEYGIKLEISNYNTVSNNKLCGNTKMIYENDCEGNSIQGNGCDPGVPGYIIGLIVGVVFVTSGVILYVIIKQKRK